MPTLQIDQLKKYLSSVYKTDVEIRSVGELGKKIEKPTKKKELKAFGYGIPYLIELVVKGEQRRVVLETMRPGGFGHDHFSDRAQVLLWQHSAFNKLPKHVRSIDVGAFTSNGTLKSLGDCAEFFIVTEMIEGQLYHLDLDRIKKEKSLTQLDKDRCQALSDYIAQVHAVKKDAPELYVRRIRDLLGHGEGIMGLTDSYPSGLDYISDEDLCEIEKTCVEWRWKLKRRYAHRCSQVHGDYHPWNVLFRTGTDFTMLDRSRGEWGDPADDISAMSINYLFYSLQTYGKLTGPFETLFNQFWNSYLDKTGDEEMLNVIQPFYAWRGLVVASPVWYPNLPLDVRTKLFNFIKNVLQTERLSLKNINSYIKS
ncbi:aminoglycoside phosphotransferase family protein [Candidatus Bathyarchaeota archaeon]|nr:MAG: aminoglycoside phosphotransferase family protein [Candidatus Bathyarchaeota archaeon]